MASNASPVEKERDDDEINDRMAESYTEIALTKAIHSQNEDVHVAQEPLEGTAQQSTKRPDSLVYDEPKTLTFDGGLSKNGNMTHFVAENLEYKIKISSPVSRKDDSGTGTPINAMSRQFFSSSQFDSNVLADIENEAHYLASSIDNLTENLCNILHSISSITVDNVEVYKNVVNKLTDSMDSNIKSMYTIMAKTEEMSKAMQPATQLATRIREIKRLVDLFESNI